MLIWFLAIVVVYYSGQFLLSEFDEMARPSTSQYPLPKGLVIDDTTMGCGSGGCWTVVVADQDQTTPRVIEELWDLDGTCQRVSLLDLRTVCATITVSGSGRDPGDPGELKVHLSYVRHLGL